MFSRIDVVEPPYIAPQNMPASMITAETGSILRVTGRRRAIVAGGPRPGRTPMAVPRIAPIAQYKRFDTDRATSNPLARFARKSIYPT
jgi:hypothetical protein